jgi:hypothetical protein
MATKKAVSHEEKLATLFVETFQTPQKVMEFIIEAFQLCIRYRGDMELSKDAAFTLEILGRELGLVWMDNPADAGANIISGAKSFMDMVWDSNIQNAVLYVLKSLVAHASDGRNGAFTQEHLSFMNRGIDFLSETAKITRQYNEDLEKQRTSELKRA